MSKSLVYHSHTYYDVNALFDAVKCCWLTKRRESWEISYESQIRIAGSSVHHYKIITLRAMHADNETMCNKRLSSERPTSTDNVRH